MNNPEQFEQIAFNEAESNNPANWSGLCGEFYFSKADSRWFVRRQKRWMGWAVNLAKPLGVLYLYLSLGFLVLLGFGMGLLVMGLVVMSWKESLPPPPKGYEIPRFKLNSWTYPKSTQISSTGERLYSYSVTEPIESVWMHYAKLVGIEERYEAGAQQGSDVKLNSNVNKSETKGSETSGGATIVSFNMGDMQRQQIRTASIFVCNQPGFSLNIFLSSGKDEGRTHITLAVNSPNP
jgi:hypothetical protein